MASSPNLAAPSPHKYRTAPPLCASTLRSRIWLALLLTALLLLILPGVHPSQNCSSEPLLEEVTNGSARQQTSLIFGLNGTAKDTALGCKDDTYVVDIVRAGASGLVVLATTVLLWLGTETAAYGQGFVMWMPRLPPLRPQAWTSESDGHTWPFFRRTFLLGLVPVLVGISFLVIVHQLQSHMVYESMRVTAYGWLTCLATGLGALPFAFLDPSRVGEREMAIAHCSAGGMMISASVGLLQEAHVHCGHGDWQILVGLLCGVIFIRASQHCHSPDEDSEVEVLHDALMEHKHLRKAILVFVVMFCHSAAEGVAVGVAFSKALSAQFGHYISLLLAVHNIPEGLAVALVLVPRGVSTPLASLIATLTSVPQPILALAAFRFVDTFEWLLPIGLAFAAGAMVYVSLHELVDEAIVHLGKLKTFFHLAASFCLMMAVQVALHSVSEL